MKKIVLTYTIVLLGCIAANAQSNAPAMATGKLGNTKAQPVVGTNKPQMAAYKPGAANKQADKATPATNPPLAPASKRKNKAAGAKKTN
ncbi:MAG: hypothetical protein M0D57_02485 [Sphingobacteriales bacterium JAD_PAG50586_3]|nr:MAG: hypothetical protein M0D57_02485 [Sphingobacteriales bacterium JAD_PAG50586_3]